MNSRNYSQKSNFMCGTEALDLLPFYAQSCNIPGINFSIPEIGGRNGYKLGLSSDTITFGSLSLQIILDENYQIFKDINKIVFDHINVETGTYAEFSFDFWVEVTDALGKSVMKIEYTNCRIETIGDLELDSMDDSTETIFTMELRYDYHTLIYPGSVPPNPTLRT
jgi:hypothetical protein